MGKYTDLSTDILSIFSTLAWQSENIKTFPENFVGSADEYIRVVVLAGSFQPANHLLSTSGQLLIEIYTPAGTGPARVNLIADTLDRYLSGKSFSSSSSGQTQLGSSNLTGGANDKVNPSLYRALYTIPFNYFGVK